MGAVERKICLLIMIKRPVDPTVRIVTFAAVGAERAAMNVVLAVARDAVIRRFAEFSAQVTAVARSVSMLPKQRKAGKVVIKSHGRCPGYLVVTSGA